MELRLKLFFYNSPKLSSGGRTITWPFFKFFLSDNHYYHLTFLALQPDMRVIFLVAKMWDHNVFLFLVICEIFSNLSNRQSCKSCFDQIFLYLKHYIYTFLIIYGVTRTLMTNDSHIFSSQIQYSILETVKLILSFE